MTINKVTPKDFQVDLFDPVDDQITQLTKLKLRIGWFEGARYDDETPVADVAFDNEFGVPSENIPPRPFFRPTISGNREDWKKSTLFLARRVLRGESTAEDMLNVIGLTVSGQIRKSIRNVQKPALSWITIQNRLEIRKDKRTMGLLHKPLIFEGLLYNSVSYIVNDETVTQPFDRWEP